MQKITQPGSMQAWADGTRAAGLRVALVPTMGALHDGHLALVAEGQRRADRVVASIFVNPIQFDRRDDFERYPRTLDQDTARCARAGVDVVFAPAPGAMYPEGFRTSVDVTGLTAPLCGRGRPGHFRGVTTVVTKLFHCVRPHFGIEIVGVPTVREADGLALSSRNRLLGGADRAAARCVPRALAGAAAAVAAGERRPGAIVARATAEIAAEPRARLEHAELCDPQTLEEVAEVAAPTLLAVAVWVGGVRLIDNRLLVPGSSETPA